MMTTLSQVLEKLRQRKQDNELRIADGKFMAPSGKAYESTELKIIFWQQHLLPNVPDYALQNRSCINLQMLLRYPLF